MVKMANDATMYSAALSKASLCFCAEDPPEPEEEPPELGVRSSESESGLMPCG